MSVPPPAKLMRSGDFAWMRVPWFTCCRWRVWRILPSRSSFMTRLSDVRESTAPKQAIALQELADAAVERALRLEARLAEPLVRHDVVALVGVGPDGREVDVELRDVLLHLQRELLLRDVRFVEPEVVRPAGHSRGVLDAID